MDLMLNITTTSNPYEKPVQAKPKLINKKKENFSKNEKQNDSAFNFQFTGNNKGKAIVVRKRVNVINNNQGKDKQTKNIKNLEKNNIPKLKNYVMRPPSSSSDDEDTNKSSFNKNYVLKPKDDHDIDEDNLFKKDNEPNIDISLNITNTNKFESSINNKAIKLSRTERLNRKQEEKFAVKKEVNSNRVLSKTEIDEGIKKFSKFPERPKKAKRKNICSTIETKLLGQRLVKPYVEKVFTGCSLETLDIHPHLVKDLSDLLNITQLTAIQQKVIPKALEGNDLLVRSQTGSGKTLAYALPIVQKLQEVRPKLTRNSGIMALIVVPTRELAIQTYEFLLKLLKPFTWIVPGYLCGGENRKSEKARLRKGINILVGTSGRLLDHILQTESCKLDKLQFLILDEADRLLELGYERDVSKIVHTIDEHKKNAKIADEFRPTQNGIENKSEHQLQRLLLSATLTSAVQKLAGLTLKNPIFIDNSDENLIENVKPTNEYENAVDQAVKEDKLVLPENLSLSYVVVHPKLRLTTLSGVLAKEFHNRKTKVLVFFATSEMVDFHHDLLNEALTARTLDDDDESDESDNEEDCLLKGVRFLKLHGAMTQLERGEVFREFRRSTSGILLTTDVAARGIDVPEVDLIIQYSPPLTLSDFVHRVGRTARAGKSGRAILFLSEAEVEFIKILGDKRIRMSQEILEKLLKSLKDADLEAHTIQEATSNLQHTFEDLIEEDKELRVKACKAYSSWLRNYATFPKELKHIFNIKKAHMGHYAKSFALKDPPSKFVSKHFVEKPSLPFNKLTYSERDEKKTKNPEVVKRKHNFSTTVSGGQRLVNNPRNSSLSQSSKTFDNRNRNFNSENKLANLSKKSIMMSVSEFDSGIPSKKMKF